VSVIKVGQVDQGDDQFDPGDVGGAIVCSHACDGSCNGGRGAVQHLHLRARHLPFFGGMRS
jgi:hypothetical protein